MTVAVVIPTLVTAGAVPVGVLNVAVLKFINGFMSNDVGLLLRMLHNILATVPFLVEGKTVQLFRMDNLRCSKQVFSLEQLFRPIY